MTDSSKKKKKKKSKPTAAHRNSDSDDEGEFKLVQGRVKELAKQIETEKSSPPNKQKKVRETTVLETHKEIVNSLQELLETTSLLGKSLLKEPATTEEKSNQLGQTKHLVTRTESRLVSPELSFSDCLKPNSKTKEEADATAENDSHALQSQNEYKRFKSQDLSPIEEFPPTSPFDETEHDHNSSRTWKNFEQYIANHCEIVEFNVTGATVEQVLKRTVTTEAIEKPKQEPKTVKFNSESNSSKKREDFEPQEKNFQRKTDLRVQYREFPQTGDMYVNEQIRVLTLNDNEHQDSTIYRIEKNWIIQFRLGPSLLGRRVSLFTNYPENPNVEFKRTRYHQLKWHQDEGCKNADDTASFAELVAKMAGSFHFYFTYDDA